jgi:hypothetical protein
MEEDYWLFRYRTIHGYIGTAVSQDKGKSWELDVLRYAPGGRPVKSPMGPFGITGDASGNRYFVWYNHSHSGFDEYVGRDLVYITSFDTIGHDLYLGEAELFHYRKDQLGYANHSHERLNTPSIHVDKKGIYGRSSDKESIRSFSIPAEFLDLLNRQASIREVPGSGLIFSLEEIPSEFRGPVLPDPSENGGFTLSFSIRPETLVPGQVLLESYGRKGFRIRAGDRQNLVFFMSDGRNEVSLSSDAGSLAAGQPHHISIIVDGYPDLVTMVVDGRFQDGGKEKYRGSRWFDHSFSDLNAREPWNTGNMSPGEVRDLYVHDRFLLTTEAIGLHRSMAGE